MCTRKFLIGLCLVLVLASLSYSKQWRGIIPLHSTRKDVEGSIGPPRERNGTEYDLPRELVIVSYSKGNCVKGWPFGWNIPPGVVTSIRIVPKTKLPLSEAGIDLTGYKQDRKSDTPGRVTYLNQQEGLSVEFNEIDGAIQAINYFPTASEQHLLCPGADSVEERAANTLKYRMGSYYNVAFNEEKSELDHLAKELARLPGGWKGYIVVYAGPRARTGEAQARADRAKNYLVREKNLQLRRINTIDGGYRETAQVDLFIVPPGGPKPVPFPTVDPRTVQLIDRAKARKVH